MEPRITHTIQGVPESLPLEWNIDAIELTDDDLAQVTGTWWRMEGFGFHRFHRFHRFHHFPFRGGFNNSTAIAITDVAIAG